MTDFDPLANRNSDVSPLSAFEESSKVLAELEDFRKFDEGTRIGLKLQDEARLEQGDYEEEQEKIRKKATHYEGKSTLFELQAVGRGAESWHRKFGGVYGLWEDEATMQEFYREDERVAEAFDQAMDMGDVNQFRKFAAKGLKDITDMVLTAGTAGLAGGAVLGAGRSMAGVYAMYGADTLSREYHGARAAGLSKSDAWQNAGSMAAIELGMMGAFHVMGKLVPGMGGSEARLAKSLRKIYSSTSAKDSASRLAAEALAKTARKEVESTANQFLKRPLARALWEGGWETVEELATSFGQVSVQAAMIPGAEDAANWTDKNGSVWNSPMMNVLRHTFKDTAGALMWMYGPAPVKHGVRRFIHKPSRTNYEAIKVLLEAAGLDIGKGKSKLDRLEIQELLVQQLRDGKLGPETEALAHQYGVDSESLISGWGIDEDTQLPEEFGKDAYEVIPGVVLTKEGSTFFGGEYDAAQIEQAERAIVQLHNKLGADMGYKLRIVDGDFGEGSIDGIHVGADKTIWMTRQRVRHMIAANPTLTDAAIGLYMHEFTHSIENTGDYDELYNYVFKNFKGQLMQARRGYEETAKRSGRDDYTPEELNREGLAAWMQDHLVKSGVLHKLAKENSTLFERIRNWFYRAADRWRGDSSYASVFTKLREAARENGIPPLAPTTPKPDSSIPLTDPITDTASSSEVDAFDAERESARDDIRDDWKPEDSEYAEDIEEQDARFAEIMSEEDGAEDVVNEEEALSASSTALNTVREENPDGTVPEGPSTQVARPTETGEMPADVDPVQIDPVTGRLTSNRDQLRMYEEELAFLQERDLEDGAKRKLAAHIKEKIEKLKEAIAAETEPEADIEASYEEGRLSELEKLRALRDVIDVVAPSVQKADEAHEKNSTIQAHPFGSVTGSEEFDQMMETLPVAADLTTLGDANSAALMAQDRVNHADHMFGQDSEESKEARKLQREYRAKADELSAKKDWDTFAEELNFADYFLDPDLMRRFFTGELREGDLESLNKILDDPSLQAGWTRDLMEAAREAYEKVEAPAGIIDQVTDGGENATSDVVVEAPETDYDALSEQQAEAQTVIDEEADIVATPTAEPPAAPTMASVDFEDLRRRIEAGEDIDPGEYAASLENSVLEVEAMLGEIAAGSEPFVGEMRWDHAEALEDILGTDFGIDEGLAPELAAEGQELREHILGRADIQNVPVTISVPLARAIAGTVEADERVETMRSAESRLLAEPAPAAAPKLSREDAARQEVAINKDIKPEEVTKRQVTAQLKKDKKNAAKAISKRLGIPLEEVTEEQVEESLQAVENLFEEFSAHRNYPKPRPQTVAEQALEELGLEIQTLEQQYDSLPESVQQDVDRYTGHLTVLSKDEAGQAALDKIAIDLAETLGTDFKVNAEDPKNLALAIVKSLARGKGDFSALVVETERREPGQARARAEAQATAKDTVGTPLGPVVQTRSVTRSESRTTAVEPDDIVGVKKGGVFEKWGGKLLKEGDEVTVKVGGSTVEAKILGGGGVKTGVGQSPGKPVFKKYTVSTEGETTTVEVEIPPPETVNTAVAGVPLEEAFLTADSLHKIGFGLLENNLHDPAYAGKVADAIENSPPEVQEPVNEALAALDELPADTPQITPEFLDSLEAELEAEEVAAAEPAAAEPAAEPVQWKKVRAGEYSATTPEGTFTIERRGAEHVETTDPSKPTIYHGTDWVILQDGSGTHYEAFQTLKDAKAALQKHEFAQSRPAAEPVAKDITTTPAKDLSTSERMTAAAIAAEYQGQREKVWKDFEDGDDPAGEKDALAEIDWHEKNEGKASSPLPKDRQYALRGLRSPQTRLLIECALFAKASLSKLNYESEIPEWMRQLAEYDGLRNDLEFIETELQRISGEDEGVQMIEMLSEEIVEGKQSQETIDEVQAFCEIVMEDGTVAGRQTAKRILAAIGGPKHKDLPPPRGDKLRLITQDLYAKKHAHQQKIDNLKDQLEESPQSAKPIAKELVAEVAKQAGTVNHLVIRLKQQRQHQLDVVAEVEGFSEETSGGRSDFMRKIADTIIVSGEISTASPDAVASRMLDEIMTGDLGGQQLSKFRVENSGALSEALSLLFPDVKGKKGRDVGKLKLAMFTGKEQKGLNVPAALKSLGFGETHKQKQFSRKKDRARTIETEEKRKKIRGLSEGLERLANLRFNAPPITGIDEQIESMERELEKAKGPQYSRRNLVEETARYRKLADRGHATFYSAEDLLDAERLGWANDMVEKFWATTDRSRREDEVQSAMDMLEEDGKEKILRVIRHAVETDRWGSLDVRYQHLAHVFRDEAASDAWANPGDVEKLTRATDLAQMAMGVASAAGHVLNAVKRLNPLERTKKSLAESFFSPPKRIMEKVLKLRAEGDYEAAARLHKSWVTDEAGSKKKTLKGLITFLAGAGIDMSDEAKRNAIMANPEEAMKALHLIGQYNSTIGDKAFEYWRNSILSGPTTQAANIIGTVFFTAYEVALKRNLMATMNLALQDPNLPTFAENLAIIQAGAVSWMGNARDNSWAALESEQHQLEYQLSEAGFNVHSKVGRFGAGGSTAIHGGSYTNPFTGKKTTVGRTVRLPQRMLLMVDERMKTSITEGYAAGFAYRAAQKQIRDGNLTKEQSPDFIAKLLDPENKADDIWMPAYQEALKQTWQRDLGKAGQLVVQMREAVPMLRFVMPFIVTPMNIFTTGIKMSPLAWLPKVVSWQQASKDESITGENRIEELGADVVNAILMGIPLAMVLGQDDDDPWVTGSESTVTQGREKYPSGREGDRPPYSIRIPGTDRWVSYSRIEPFATALGATVDAAKAIKSGAGGRWEEATGVGLEAVYGQLTEKTYIRGIGDIAKAFRKSAQGDVIGGMGAYGSNFVASWVPNLVRAPARALQTSMPDRKVYGENGDKLRRLAEGTLKRTEILSAMGVLEDMPKVDMWGREFPRHQGFGKGWEIGDFLYKVFVPVQIKTTHMFVGDQTMRRYNNSEFVDENPEKAYVGPEAPERYFEIKGKKHWMTPQQYDEMCRMSGTLAAELCRTLSLDVENPTELDVKKLQQSHKNARAIAKEALTEKWWGSGDDSAVLAATAEGLRGDMVKAYSRILSQRTPTIKSLTREEKRLPYAERVARLREKKEDVMTRKEYALQWLQSEGIGAGEAARSQGTRRGLAASRREIRKSYRHGAY